MVDRQEVSRRYEAIRARMDAAKLDALIVCGNQYTGFEGAVRYVSGFEIVHRYVYVLLPLKGEPVLVFPKEARWIGDKAKPWVQEQVWPDVPGEWLRAHAYSQGWKRVGVYGLDYIMTVRDYRALSQDGPEIVPFDYEFDMARAVKSPAELEAIRDSMSIIVDGFYALLKAYQPGRTEAQIMAPAVELFFARGAGPRMMNIVLSGTHGEADAHFKVPGHRVVNPDDLMLYSLELAGAEGYWVEFSRPIIREEPSRRTQAMMEIYPEAIEAARKQMRAGQKASDVHHAFAAVFARQGFGLGHLSGHSIGTTMIEHPALGASSDTVLQENMTFAFHPQSVDQDGKVCLYMQDTYRVGKEDGECLASVPWQFFSGAEA